MNGLRTIDSPIRIEGEAKRPPRMAPKIGEHTRQVLTSFGYDEREISAMLASGAAAE
jgi:crotonobetainyl-CoA:carnitine CoA-transferase CaiB-like acyl-CoA transferase